VLGAMMHGIEKIFGPLAKIQHCPIHELRHILGHFPDRLHESGKAVLREAWGLDGAKMVTRRLQRLASSLEGDRPGANAPIQEGLDETRTLQNGFAMQRSGRRRVQSETSSGLHP